MGSINSRCNEKSVGKDIKKGWKVIYFFDNKDMYQQVLRQVETTNYSADIVRIQKVGEEREGKERLLVGKACL